MLTDILACALREHGDAPAVADRHAALTYRELDAAADRHATGLGALLTGRDRPRVGIQAANSTDYVVAYLAALRAGCVPFLIDRAAGPQETEGIQRDCGLDLLVHEEATPVPGHGTRLAALGSLHVTRFPEVPDRPELHRETEVCRFTSGSTGRPSCIEFRGDAVYRAAVNWAEGTRLSSRDTILCFASLSNGLAFNTSLLSAFLVGACLRLGSGLPTAGAVTRTLRDSGATRLIGFPALYESLVRNGSGPGRLPELRMAISSAAPLNPRTKRLFEESTGVPLQNYYGIAEAGPLTYAADPRTDPGLGQPLPGVELRAGAAGEPGVVSVRSQSMGTRYLNAPGALERRIDRDGFYRTGDVGHLRDGSLVLTGRTSQVINIGGRKIDAVEVSTALAGAPGVDDAVVLEITDRHGTAALAAVLAGAPGLDPAAPRRHVAERLAPYKVPSLVRIVPRIPRGTSGKPATAELRRLFDTPQDFQ
ncbi:class I adenylate-forming enzyme family protein [Streptomyces sp. NPDC088707]|uniref:class I adenylate-forming enzyme family protein n=1 Tax=Streptomyces sp. NPDC088707 TaxID=3365871 RepID=UPI003814C083